MGLPGIRVWTWTLFFVSSRFELGLDFPPCQMVYVCVFRVCRQYMVAIPSLLEAGAETKFCVSLLQPNETLDMTITLSSEEQNTTTLLKKTTSEEFHECLQFQVPIVQNEKVYTFEVEVKGDTFSSKEVRKVMARVYQPLTFIQTDKPIYLPGQTGTFERMIYDFVHSMLIYTINRLVCTDADDNRVAQWLNQTSDGSILQLSYSLNSEAREGTYQVIVTVGEMKIYHNFQVEKYVLPKFDVKITTLDVVSIQQEEIEAEICAKYTYGHPVPGSAKVKMCRPLSRYYASPIIFTPLNPDGIPDIVAPCYEETKKVHLVFQPKSVGTTRPMISLGIRRLETVVGRIRFLTRAFEARIRNYLDLSAEVEEEGTGKCYSNWKRQQISYMIGKLSFFDTPKIYDSGSNVEGKAVHFNDTPIRDMPVYLFEGERWSSRRLRNLTTDSDGVAAFSFNTINITGDINIFVSTTPELGYSGYRTPYHETGHHTVFMAQLSSPDTKPVSALEVQKKDKPLACDTEVEISIKYTVVGEKQGSATLMYLVLSRGAIVMQGFELVEVQDETVMEGKVSFKLNVQPEIAPGVQVVAYAVLPSENVIAHKVDFSVEKCFSHKVSLEFSPSSPVPGDETTMQLKAQPGSLCGVSAVDQSVLIKSPGKSLNANQVRAGISHKYLLALFLVSSAESFAPLFFLALFRFAPEVARMETRVVAMSGSAGPAGGGLASNSEAAPIETVRTFFPETWIWDLVAVGASGTKDVSLTVPDTITTWETEAFCLSPQGFGLAPRKEITVFQPFFLELTLPYSIIRGEHFELKATTFNYMSSCIMVTVTPEPSSDYTLTPLSGDLYTSCLCGSERQTLSWTMAPSALGVMNVSVTAEAVASHASCDNEIVSVPDRGRIDKVTRSLIVKAEGTEMTKTHNLLLCPKGEALTEEVELQLPKNVINGSARASVSVLGDILGRALKNLDGLLKMPYGCGEQNMALLAPNIYILQYLKNTQQLTPAIVQKATNFLTSGYQRQLNYKDREGAYSTFGSGAGNTWLTAFVLRSFTKAQSFIYIDPTKIEESKHWLDREQRENGCFKKSGRLFNNRMKGGVSDEVTLSAYITAAFLEVNASDPVVKKSLSCLRESTGNLSNTYTTALLAYVFTLAGDMETRALSSSERRTLWRGFLHWSQTAEDTSASLSVEISSYVMLAKLSASPTTSDLGYASRIVRWLTTQQNYYGGFSSTQDTVVALQALALYSTLVFSPAGSSAVTVKSPSGTLNFEVNQSNKLLYQEETLQDVTGTYGVEVKGTTCASMQFSVQYNIPTPVDVTTFSVQVRFGVRTSVKACNNCPFDYCRYLGKEEITNMVILDIKMLSGFVPDPESLKKVSALLVDRVEEKEDRVLVYIQELPTGIPIHHSLVLIQEHLVQNMKPAVVKIYDYYQPSDQTETDYTYPCAAGNNPC
uniref:Si:ch211-212c13.8 n=1 Tax=Scophthalmus maximus TaxID=52904 RepID=A0A8D3CNB8_SCOMX